MTVRSRRVRYAHHTFEAKKRCTSAPYKLLVQISLFAAIFLSSQHATWGNPIDTTRLLAASQDAKNWLLPGHDYTNQRYVALSHINTQNVKSLTLHWKFHTGIREAFQTTPLVADGVMYITTPRNHIVALDARTGKQLWRYEYALDSQHLCCGSANRGAGLGYGKIYMATADAHLIAVDQPTGKLVWDVALASAEEGKTETVAILSTSDPLRQAAVTGASGIGANMAPLVYKGKVIVGVTGAGYGLHLDNSHGKQPIGAVVGMAGAYGRRGFLAAFDAETGKELWRWYTIPDTGWEGEWRATTPDGVLLHRDLAAEKAAFATYTGA